ncbi:MULTISPECIES: SH3 domain-containing protein [Aerosakkonema]|uniref:SH3 domain-containing protein n=1 Tax=Aerosakkonema TaxID=1246629 RepID=UPI0035B71445
MKVNFIFMAIVSGFFTVLNTPILSSAQLDICRNYTVQDPLERYVNLRATPNGRIIRRITNGTQVTATGIERNGWLQVRVGKSRSRGWIDGDGLVQNEDYVVFDPKDTGVNIRQEPNGEIIGRIPNGTTIDEPINYVGNWAEVPQFNGFINERLIREPDCDF